MESRVAQVEIAGRYVTLRSVPDLRTLEEGEDELGALRAWIDGGDAIENIGQVDVIGTELGASRVDAVSSHDVGIAIGPLLIWRTREEAVALWRQLGETLEEATIEA